MYNLQQLADHIHAEVLGDNSLTIASINTLNDARAGEITFLSNPKYKTDLLTTQATAVILSADVAEQCPVAALVVDNPYLGFARIAQLLDTTPIEPQHIHPKACIHSDAKVASGVSIGACAVIESNAVIEQGASIGAGCYVGRGSIIGENTRLFPNVTLYHDVQIGRNGIVHSGTVIGSDGFGFANDKGEWVKIPQIGKVIIGDNFECGANCTIDRGAIHDTVIGDGVKFDNLCHVAHNVKMGSRTAMAAYSGVAGSSNVGNNCTLAGRSTILGHIDIVDDVHITAGSQASKSITQPGIYSASIPLMQNKEWRKNMVRLKQLDKMARQVDNMTRQVKEFDKTLQEITGDNKDE